MSPSARPPGDLKVLFTSAFRAPFIDDDLISLKALYNVRELTGHGVKQAWRIFRNVFRSDVLFCWFGSVYAGIGVFASRIAGIPSIIVVAGVDAAKDPDLDYGIWLSPWRSKFVRYAFLHATHVLVVDPSLKDALQRLAQYDGRNIRFLPSGYSRRTRSFDSDRGPGSRPAISSSSTPRS